jgi:hypothetical protein
MPSPSGHPNTGPRQAGCGRDAPTIPRCKRHAGGPSFKLTGCLDPDGPRQSNATCAQHGKRKSRLLGRTAAISVKAPGIEPGSAPYRISMEIADPACGPGRWTSEFSLVVAARQLHENAQAPEYSTALHLRPAYREWGDDAALSLEPR